MSMRINAKRHNKSVPSYKELESMIQSNGMKCFNCDKELNWLRKEDSKKVITLQHDDNGDLKFLCIGCNTTHAKSSRDLMYSINNDEKFCKSCNSIKSKKEFYKDNSRPCGLKSSCKQCSNERFKSWKNENKERYNEYQREYRR